MSRGYIDTSGMIHDFQCIADIASLETKKAELFLTLPFSYFKTYRWLLLNHGFFQPICCI